MEWNVKLLLEDFSCLYGEKQSDLLSPCIYSIVDREFYARFHFKEGTKLLKEFLEDKDDQNALIMLVLHKDQDESSEFYLRRRQAKAHMVACMQSLHALSDTLAHVVYFATGQNRDKKTCLESKKVLMFSVQKALELDPTKAEIEGLLKQLTEHIDYRYLADIVNHSKHRRIIGTPFSVSMIEDADQPPYGLQLEAFEYEGRTHSSKWLEPFLEREYKRQADLIIQIGEKLNRWVKNKRTIADL
ncbi:hypothetical protein C8R26_11556 [Nitrosomonas oligotropha]|uniref:Uncharacterized protein n=1 Tax=Nitrosomonas oligotropha TaxID=42354 RepID=A0A2T5HYL1_9PROT|nr:hypothetical protein [Nitrosomonas oligotropha]PTQ76657.1 hypothetical protein C8R26_11556 [Nitrosomonas oligotropha]